MRYPNFGSLSVVALCLPSLAFSMTQENGDPLVISLTNQNVEVGFGWNSSTQEVTANRCIQHSILHDPGQSSSFDMIEVNKRSELQDALDVGLSLDVPVYGMDIHAESQWTSSSSLETGSYNLVLKATVLNGKTFAVPVDFPKSAYTGMPVSLNILDAPPIRQNFFGASAVNENKKSPSNSGFIHVNPELEGMGPDEFRKFCGTHYVAALYGGATLSALLSIADVSSEDKQALKASLAAEYAGVKVGANALSEKERKEYSERTSLKIQQKGGARGMIPMDKEGFKQKMGTLAEEAESYPTYLAMQVVPYTNIRGVPSLGSSGGIEKKQSAYNIYWAATDVYTRINDILEDPSAYDASTGYGIDQLPVYQEWLLYLRKTSLRTIKADDEKLFGDNYGKMIRQVQALAGATYDYQIQNLATIFKPERIDDHESKGFQQMLNSAEDMIRFGSSLKNVQQYTDALYLKLPVKKCLGDRDIDCVDPDEKKEFKEGEKALQAYVVPSSQNACLSNPLNQGCYISEDLNELKRHVGQTRGPGIRNGAKLCISFQSNLYCLRDQELMSRIWSGDAPRPENLSAIRHGGNSRSHELAFTTERNSKDGKALLLSTLVEYENPSDGAQTYSRYYLGEQGRYQANAPENGFLWDNGLLRVNNIKVKDKKTLSTCLTAYMNDGPQNTGLVETASRPCKDVETKWELRY